MNSAAIARDRGSVTAEFAIVLPAVLMVLAFAIASIMLSTHRLGLAATAAELARLEARGDTAAAADRLEQLESDVAIERTAQGALHCVVLRSSPLEGALQALTISARACAALSGQP